MCAISRRRFLERSLRGLAAVALARAGLSSNALGAGVRPAVRAWLRELEALCSGLRQRKLTPTEWQDEVARIYAGLELDELLAAVDFDRLIAGIEFPSDRAATREVRFPPSAGLPARPSFSRRVFALEKGRAIVPHAHNDMVSAHLVARGRFRVRTFDRLFDREIVKGHLTLRPSLDRELGPGELLTMSDDRDNIHWLVATTPTAFTFDVPVAGLGLDRAYPTPAQVWGMIFVDPTVKPESSGEILAPVLDPEEAFRRFGREGT